MKKHSLYVIVVLLVSASAGAAAAYALAMKYKSDIFELKKILSVYEHRKSGCSDEAIADMIEQRSLRDQDAEQSLDLLQWKSLLSEEIREANDKFSSSVLALKDLKTKKELANLLYYTLGLTYTAVTDFSAARESFLKALQFDPRDNQSLYSLALLYTMHGIGADPKKALQYYQKYLEVFPGSPKVEQVKARIEDLKKETGRGK